MARQSKPSFIPRLREIDVQLQCVSFMRLDGWRPLRTDPCSDRGRGKGFGEEGMADHLFIRYSPDGPLGAMARRFAEVLWVEFKRPAGRDVYGRNRAATRAGKHQIDWHFAERMAGGVTVIAGQDFGPTYDGFVEWYRKSGLLKRAGL